MREKERIIVALDVSSLDELAELVDQLKDCVGMFKIGINLYTRFGPKAVQAVKKEGAKVFLDLKYNDIPEQVGGAAKEAGNLGVYFFTVHASGGARMMVKAAENKGESKILAVSVLTSLTRNESVVIYGSLPEFKVIEFARMAVAVGIEGLVCSPQELKALNSEREIFSGFKRLLKVTPGIRPSWAASQDHARIATPLEAIKLGADYLVIGRPITRPPKNIGSPRNAAEKIIEEISLFYKATC